MIGLKYSEQDALQRPQNHKYMGLLENRRDDLHSIHIQTRKLFHKGRELGKVQTLGFR